MKYYTGVGSRQTPDIILGLMTRAAEWLARQGWCLRSGGADEADSAFFAGFTLSPHEGKPRCEIYLLWVGFNNVPPTVGIALENLLASIQENAEMLARFEHPAWNRCSEAGRKLHARNALQVCQIVQNVDREPEHDLLLNPRHAADQATGPQPTHHTQC